MTVTNLWTEGRMYSAFQVSHTARRVRYCKTKCLFMQSNNDDPETSPFDIKAPGVQELVDAATLNSNIKFDRTDVPFAKRTILGDATETGLARFSGKCVADYDSHLQKHKKVFDVPFSSVNKWALVIVSETAEVGNDTTDVFPGEQTT